MADPRPLTRRELSEFLPNQRAIRAFEKLFDLIPADILTLLEQIDAAFNVASSAATANVRNLGLIRDLDLTNKNLVFVGSTTDLPLPVSGVIALRNEFTYYFTAEVDLRGSRLVAGTNTTILGSSSENCKIKSTGLPLGTALLSSEYSIPIRHISLEAATVLNLDATGNAGQAIDWYGVNIENTTDIGIIKNYNNFVVGSMAFLSASGLAFDGVIGTIGFTNCIFVGTAPGTIIALPASAEITRRIRFAYSAFIAFGSGVAVDVDLLATVPVEGYVFDTCNFSGGGIYIQGVQHTDNRARWIENRGINNSATLTGYYMQGNAIATTIVTPGVAVKIEGSTTETDLSQRFDHTDNRATYVGAITRGFKVSASVSLSAGNNNQIAIAVYKNGVEIPGSRFTLTTNSGGRLENGVTFALLTLEDTDYVELWVTNDTNSSSVTVEDLNLAIEALN